MDLQVAVQTFGAVGALAFVTNSAQILINRRKTSLEVRQLEATLSVSDRDSSVVVLERVNAVLERQASRDRERIMHLEAQLETRDSKIDDLSQRLETLMLELGAMQTELGDLRRDDR